MPSSSTLSGGQSNDILAGNTWNNTLIGLGGDDSIYGREGNDTLNGGAGNDFMQGGSEADLLDGGIGNDYLDGGTGADMMAGRAGDDRYVVDSVWDMVSETMGEGADRVISSVNHTLGAHVESLVLTGIALYATGNALDNVITGNGADNILTGWHGNDVLDAGAGQDLMMGGPGNDTYLVDTLQDTVREASGQGVDTIRSGLATIDLAFGKWLQGQEIENVTLLSIGDDVVGNRFDNVITGNGRANELRGNEGQDTLIGMENHDDLFGDAGQDVLRGGTGNDALTGGLDRDILGGGYGDDWFIFEATRESTIDAPDRISDFIPGAGSGDVIDVSVIDANSGLMGNQVFTFNAVVGAALGNFGIAFSHVGGDTLIQGEVNGDGKADFAIILTGTLNLTVSDFIL